MKLLIYGGCHALIVRRLILDLGVDKKHAVDLLINFVLIQSGEKFPYDRIREYDAVIYSPIENKGEHNTCYLDEACKQAGVQAIRFPWLEWHGYAPGSDKGIFWGHVGWYFPEFLKLSESFDKFEPYAETILKEYPRDETIQYSLEYSTEKLRAQEERMGCEVKVSDFILNTYRDRRLFSIPDHPTLLLYRHLIEGIETALGQRLISYWPNDVPEPQSEAYTPIFPRVLERLGLAFDDRSWRCETQPLEVMGLDAFLRLHFVRGHAMRDLATAGETSDVTLATACRTTWLTPPTPDAGGAGPIQISVHAQILIRREALATGDEHFRAEFVAPLARVPETIRTKGEYLFRTEDWACRN